MNLQDIIFILKWFTFFFIIGAAFLPMTFSLFSFFKDKGYIFSKVIGLALISYCIFILGFLKLASFEEPTIYLSIITFIIINYTLLLKDKMQFLDDVKKYFKLFIFEEFLFIAGLFLWTFIRGNAPDINGLEKFMDFGFINSILRSNFFPPKDMWYTPLPINYYYFGHLVTAVLIKLSQIPSFVSFNLMISTIFSITLVSSFSIGMTLFYEKGSILKNKIAGIITALLLTFGGNLTTVHAFFKPYIPQDKPVPFWQLPFSPLDFPNGYWYPNATRYIPFTIHEFPLYSFVVSDLHGHVLDIPFVFLAIALSLSIFVQKSIKVFHLIFASFLIAVMYMTNAWDGIIYFLLIVFVISFINLPKLKPREIFKAAYLYKNIKQIVTIFIGFVLFVFPFSINFKPFVSGIGILCSPKLLTNIGKVGPFLFEADHCQKSPIWQLFMLYGFFYFFIVVFILFLKKLKKYKITPADIFVLILITLSSLLIIVPEFIYVKDIYPLHYRANTMFKLVYQSFIMLSLSSGYIIIKLIYNLNSKVVKTLFIVCSGFLVFFIFIYPFFAINSFYNNLKNYQSLNGIKYIQKTNPEDYALINWINNNIKGQPVILEANGDSYTNYARISTNTGLPTVIGWPVHEWLWRGTYDIVAPRIEDVAILYETPDINLARKVIKKYNIAYIAVSTLEKEKYPNLNQEKFKKLGKIIYSNQKATLYKINFEVLR